MIAILAAAASAQGSQHRTPAGTDILSQHVGTWEYVASSYADELGIADAQNIINLLTAVSSNAPDQITRNGAREWRDRISSQLSRSGFTQPAASAETLQVCVVSSAGVYWKEAAMPGAPQRVLQTLVRYGSFHADRQDRHGESPRFVVSQDDPARRPMPYLFQILTEAQAWLYYAESASDIKEGPDSRVAVLAKVWDDQGAAGLTFPPWYKATVSFVAVHWKGTVVSRTQERLISLRDYQGLPSQEIEVRLEQGSPAFLRKTVFFPFSRKRYFEIVVRAVRHESTIKMPDLVYVAATPSPVAEYHDTRDTSRMRATSELHLIQAADAHGDKATAAQRVGSALPPQQAPHDEPVATEPAPAAQPEPFTPFAWIGAGVGVVFCALLLLRLRRP